MSHGLDFKIIASGPVTAAESFKFSDFLKLARYWFGRRSSVSIRRLAIRARGGWASLPEEKAQLHQQAFQMWAAANALSFTGAWA